MTLRSLRYLTAAAVSAAAVLTAVPASAAPDAPAVSALDLSVPGHVSGTVTTGAAWVAVTTGEETVVLPTSGGSVDFDLTTWGLTDATLAAIACPDSTVTGCSPATSAPFAAVDVVPQITWPADLSIGSTQDVSVTVSDPDGGGQLKAIWQGTWHQLDRNGTTVLNLSDGSGELQVYRCDPDDQYVCTPFTPVQKVALAVRRTTQAQISTDTGNLFNGTVSTVQPTVKRLLRTFRDEALPYTLDWHLRTGGVDVPGSTDTQSGTLSATGALHFEVDGEGLLDGSYAIAGTLTVHHPDFGDVIGAITQGTVIVDKTPSTFATKVQSTSKIFPNVGAYGYRGSVAWQLTGITGDPSGNRIEVRASDGSVVSRPILSRSSPSDPTWQAVWDGRNSSTRTVVPEGTYSARLIDAAGNPGPGVGWVSVSLKKLVVKTFRKTVQAAGSTVGGYTGKCSQLKRPVRGWVGSQGYYANTKCSTQTSAASEVNTVHEMKLPAAAKYLEVRVETYGGSALSKPGSRGVVVYLEDTGKWLRQSVTGTTVKTHVSPNVTASRYVWPDHYFVWGFATAFGQRFDVRDFTVVVKYYAVE